MGRVHANCRGWATALYVAALLAFVGLELMRVCSLLDPTLYPSATDTSWRGNA